MTYVYYDFFIVYRMAFNTIFDVCLDMINIYIF